MAAPKWFLEADYLQACNCDYGCPCEFEAPPTMGFCEGLGAWKIKRGQFGDLSLDGLAFGFAAHWPKAIHEGNGTAALFFDEKASQAQRDALVQIATAQAGGMPFEIIVTTITNLLPFQFVPFQFHMDGKNSSVQVGDNVKIGLAPIKNPVTGKSEGVRVVHETGFIFQSAEALAGAVCEVNLEGLKFAWPNKAGFLAQIRYSN
jgi:hypothetical protein